MKNDQTEKYRILWVDLLKIFAMLEVISVHVCACFSWDDLSDFDRKMIEITGLPLHGCVTFFFLMSGMLLLDKKPNIKRLWTSRISRLVAAIIIRLVLIVTLMVAVAVTGCIVYSHPFPVEIFDDFQSNDNMFLYSMIAIYIVYPFLYDICQDRKKEEYFLLLSFIFSVIIPILKTIPATSFITSHIAGQMNEYFPFGIPLIFVLGHWLYRYVFPVLERFNKWLLLFFAFAGVILNILIREYVPFLTANEVAYVGFCELVICVPIFCFFGVVVSKWDIKNDRVKNLIFHMGENGIAIFVLHWTVINFIRACGVMPDQGHFLIGRPLWTAIVYMVSFWLSLIWEKMPILNKVIR